MIWRASPFINLRFRNSSLLCWVVITHRGVRFTSLIRWKVYLVFMKMTCAVILSNCLLCIIVYGWLLLLLSFRLCLSEESLLYVSNITSWVSSLNLKILWRYIIIDNVLKHKIKPWSFILWPSFSCSVLILTRFLAHYLNWYKVILWNHILTWPRVLNVSCHCLTRRS